MCTGILIKTEDGKIVFGRTLEFGYPLIWKKYNKNGIRGTTGHFKGNREHYLTDGINRHGLLVATFFYPHYEKEYNNKTLNDKENVFTTDLNLLLLKYCQNISDVKKKIKDINLKLKVIHNMPFSLHWIVADLSGKSIVLEVKNGKTEVYDNPLGVITNSPTFKQHLNYNKKFGYLSVYTKVGSYSQGTGGLGLPGDSSSLSRFVRANFYKKNTPVAKSSYLGEKRLFRILHNFDIPIGSVIDPKTKEIDITEYTTVYSLNNFNHKYAPYGYIQKNNKWIQTQNPVKQ